MAARELHPNFPKYRNFRPRALFIATWDNVGYFEKKYDPVSMDMIVLVSGSRIWFEGRGRSWVTNIETRPHVGTEGPNCSKVETGRSNERLYPSSTSGSKAE